MVGWSKGLILLFIRPRLNENLQLELWWRWARLYVSSTPNPIGISRKGPMPNQVRTQTRTILLTVVFFFGALSQDFVTGARAAENDSPELRSDHPQRYVVKKGDTLWGIAGKFLVDPWRWREIWQQNPSIENPHLIYPGDVLVLSTDSGTPEVRVLRNRKITKLSPTVREEPLDEAVPTIAPSVILPFLRKPLIISRGDLDDAPYVAIGEEGGIALGKYSVFFGRGFKHTEAGDLYHIFRPGRKLVHPETGEALGIQAIHLGIARTLNPGETATMEIILSHEDVNPGDRMLPLPEDISLPYFVPRAPDQQLSGIIVDAPESVDELSRLSTVVISLGERDQIEPGHVLRIMRKEPLQKDPVTGKLFQPPLQESGLAMVFRSFEKVSYALVMTSNRVINIYDRVETP